MAQRRGVAAFVLDGVVRDLTEIREAGFPVYAQGVIPIPGTKKKVGSVNENISCGGFLVRPGDIVVADEEGVVVAPADHAPQTLVAARAKLAKEAGETLDAWETQHRARIDEALRAGGFTG